MGTQTSGEAKLIQSTYDSEGETGSGEIPGLSVNCTSVHEESSIKLMKNASILLSSKKNQVLSPLG